MPEIPPPMPSIFSGRLRGTWHYEAELPDDTMTKFLVLVGEDRERAKAVKSAKFSLVNDALHNTGLINHFNDCLLPYTLTDDNSDGPYPILTDAALRMKAYQRDLVSQRKRVAYTAEEDQTSLSQTTATSSVPNP